MPRTLVQSGSNGLRALRRIAAIGALCSGLALSSTVTGANAQSVSQVPQSAPGAADAATSQPLKVSVSPTSGPIGTLVTISVSGLDGTGRVDFSAPYPIGTLLVTGKSIKLQTRLWADGQIAISADWVRFELGEPISQRASTTFETTSPQASTSTTSTTTINTTTTSTVAPNPIPNPLFFIITDRGWRAAIDGAVFSPWVPGSGGATIANGILSGKRSTFDARLVFRGELATPGRSYGLAGLPLTLVDRTSPVVPIAKLVALSSSGRILTSVSAPCTNFSGLGGPGVFSCKDISFVTPPKTAEVQIVLSTSTPLYLLQAPSTLGGPLEPQFGTGGTSIPSV
jgi:hypothetical protein